MSRARSAPGPEDRLPTRSGPARRVGWYVRRSVASLTARFGRLPDFVIVGTGRCGTQATSVALTRAGIATGHEEVYRAKGVLRGTGLRGDASWLAVPYLAEFPGKVGHQVRHPADVVASFLSLDFFGEPNTPYE